MKTAYSDGTPDVVYGSYNRQALPRQITDVSGEHTLAYDELGRLLSDTLGTLVLSNHYDTVYGRDYVRLADNGSELFREDFAYASADGRLAAVSSGSCSNVYAYLANSDLIQSVTGWQSGTTVLTTTRGYEYGFRLTNIANVVNGNTVSAHAYTYDTLNRRTQARRADGSTFAYGYNDRSEVVSGQRRWADGSFVAGQQYQYAYDNIGNRTRAGSGGNEWGAGLRYADFTANALNQYESQTVPATLDVLGTATNAATVTVNNGAASRKADYFRCELAVNNSSGPAYQSVVTLGVCRGAGAGGLDLLEGETNHVLVAKTPQSFSYDLDGNLTSDGLWSYTWDGENRLAAMTLTNVSDLPNAERKQLTFGYDYQGRRLTKIVSTWNVSAFVPQSTNRFVYDGWNCIAILNSSFSLLNSFVWGLDLSGTMNGAGGIGGLLLVVDHGTNTTSHFAGYDGNGNVTVLVQGDRTVSANYEYGPFGEPIRVSGSYAKANPLRWSTKFTDDDSGLVYYGYRYYTPSQGRWIGRDPTTDQVFLNLYLFCHNNSIGKVDIDGRFEFGEVLTSMAIGAGMNGAFGAGIGAVTGTGALRGFVSGTISGAITGGLAGPLINGLGAVFGSALAGAAGNGAAAAISSAIWNGSIDWGSVKAGLAGGAIGGGIFGASAGAAASLTGFEFSGATADITAGLLGWYGDLGAAYLQVLDVF